MLNRLVAAATGRRREKEFRTAEHVVSTQEADAMILLDVRRGKYYTLTGVGGRIWALFAGGATVSTVVERLSGEFEVEPERLSADVQVFVEELRRSKLLTS